MSVIQPSQDILGQQKNIHRLKNCDYCDIEFSHGANNSKYCGLCQIEYKCPACKTIESTQLINSRFSSTELIEIKRCILNNIYFAKACSIQCRASIRKARITGPGNCKVCGHFINSRSIIGTCDNCYSKMRKRATDPNTQKGKSSIKAMMNGHTAESRKLIIANRESNGWKPNTENLVSKPSFILGNNCSIHPHEDRMNYSRKSYRCWSCIKIEISKSQDLQNISDWINQVDLPYHFSSMPTYREKTFNKTGQLAMEQDLIDNNFLWIVYIKFYRKPNGLISPLVVGKTGSKLVNTSGTDINFKYNGENPGRTFLREEKLSWHHSHIAIANFRTEKMALNAEYKIHNILNLSYS